MRPRLLFLGLLALAALALPAAGLAQDGRPTLSEIEREVMCPVCGVPLELAHEAPQARQERRMIQELIDQGRTKEEIKDALVAEYGPDVLAIPGTSGFDLTAWLVPGVAILIAGGGIAVGLRRWRRSTALAAAGPSDPESAPLEPEDARRLDADLRRYEL